MEWLTQAYRQIAEAGLNNKDAKPEDTACQSGHPLEYEWTDGSMGYWRLPRCRMCAEIAKEAKRAELAEKRLDIARVPKMLRRLSLGHLFVDDHNAAAFEAVKRWADPAWVMFTGPVGTGKTSWATALFNCLAGEGGKWSGAMWMTESGLFELCDVAHKASGYTGRQAQLSRVITSPLLMLDDLGAGRSTLTEWQSTSMRHLFDTRHSNELPTFITTNLRSMQDIADRYGGHVASRISEASGGGVLVGGPDRRRRSNQ